MYLEQPDLTTPARRCSRKSGAVRIKRCFVEQIGFTEACAESWTYNAINTRDRCRDPCVKTYGALNLLMHRYPAPNNLPDGSLNACLRAPWLGNIMKVVISGALRVCHTAARNPGL